MDQAITRAPAAPRLVGEFQGYIDGVEPSVTWADRKNMPQVGDRLYALPARAAVPRTWSILLTSANHGTVGPFGSTFPHAGDKHERVQVMEIVEAGAPPAPGTDLAGLVRLPLTNEQIAAGAAVHCDFGKPLGRNAAINVFDAMSAGGAPVAAQAGQVAVPGWISVDERLPDAGHCLATYRNRHGKLRIIRAKYARQFEIDAGEDAIDQGNCEYNEADDTFYLKAGWLECIDNWDDYSSIYVTEGEVTHWMPLPAAPSPAKESK